MGSVKSEVIIDNQLWVSNKDQYNDRGHESSFTIGKSLSPEVAYACSIDSYTIPTGAILTSAYFYFYLGTARGELRLYASKTFEVRSSDYKGCLYDISDGVELSELNTSVSGWNRIKLNTTDLQDYTSFMLVPNGGDSRMSIYTEDSTNIPYLVVNYDFQGAKAPTNLQPRDISIARTKENRFTWDFNPSFSGDYQTGFKLEYSLDGINWTVITENTSDNYYTFLANHFTDGDYTWRIKVQNKSYEWSDYSNQEIFRVFGIPDPVIINSIKITDARPLVSWETDVDTLYYNVKLKENIKVLEDSGKLYGKEKFYKVKTLLNDKTNYEVVVTIENQDNLVSEESVKSYATAFVVPSTSNTFIVSIDLDGVASLKMINSNDIVKNEIYRKIEGEVDYFQVGEISKNGTYKDYELLNDTKYYYKIKCFNAEGSYLTTTTNNCFCKFHNSQLINITKNEIAKMKWITSKDTSFHTDQKVLNFSNRKYSVVEFGILEEEDINITVEVKTDALNKIIEMFQGKQVLLFKDNRKRLKTVIISNFNVSDQIRKKTYVISLSLKKVGENYERNKY